MADPSRSREAPEAPAARPELEVEAGDVRAATFMGIMFVGAILVAMLLAETFVAQNVPPVFEDPESATNPLLYLGIVVIFTLIILLIARLGLQRVIQAIILGAILFTMAYVTEPLLDHYVPSLSQPGLGGVPWSVSLSLVAATALTLLLFFYPEWYVIDAAGVTVAAGATGIFGFSFGLFPSLILLVGFAVYDAIAVYRTEHMLDLADNVLELRLPIMLVVPKVAGYSFREEAQHVKNPGPGGATTDRAPWEVAGESVEDWDMGSRDALFMGLGDIVIPGVLVVSAFMFLRDQVAILDSVAGLAPHTFVALSTLFGATVGFTFLMRAVLKGRAHAGLPALNGGALVAFLISVVALYGFSPLIPSF